MGDVVCSGVETTRRHYGANIAADGRQIETKAIRIRNAMSW